MKNELTLETKAKIEAFAEIGQHEVNSVKCILNRINRQLPLDLKDPKRKAITEMVNQLNTINSLISEFEAISNNEDRVNDYCDQFVKECEIMRDAL